MARGGSERHIAISILGATQHCYFGDGRYRQQSVGPQAEKTGQGHDPSPSSSLLLRDAAPFPQPPPHQATPSVIAQRLRSIEVPPTVNDALRLGEEAVVHIPPHEIHRVVGTTMLRDGDKQDMLLAQRKELGTFPHGASPHRIGAVLRGEDHAIDLAAEAHDVEPERPLVAIRQRSRGRQVCRIRSVGTTCRLPATHSDRGTQRPGDLMEGPGSPGLRHTSAR